MGRLHAITMAGPWAWTIFHRGRDVENRTWEPPEWLVGQWLAIHAGALESWSVTTWRHVVDQDPRLRDQPLEVRERFIRERMSRPERAEAERCAWTIVGVVKVAGIRRPLAVKRFLKGWWDTARFGLELASPVAFRQGVPSRGSLAPLLWPVLGQTLEAVREEYRRAVSRDTE